MRTKRDIRTLYILVAFLFGISGEAWADISSDDIIIDDGISNGTVVVSDITDRTVTLTVEPASGYKIKRDLIVVEKMVNPGPERSPRRRTPGIGTFDLTGTPDWVTSATNYTFTIPAEYDGAYVTATFVSTAATPKVIASLDEIDDFTAAGNYKLGRDIVASGSSLGEFSGTLDGDSHIIYNLSNPLFSSINGGTVKNLFFDNVSISGGTNAGAVCGEATGDSRIFNCGVLATGSIVETDAKGYTSITSSSSSVSGTGSVGGLVGVLDGTSRVINCFSYANITGGNLVGGIVGENKVATTSSNLGTMVMNCMFYGDITGGTNKAPIYNGSIITNRGDQSGVGNYNYFRSDASWAKNPENLKAPNGTPNCALMAEDRFLQRFEFFRHLLNSHLELAGWWATGTYDKSEMMKWVLDPSQIGTSTPYPILKTPGKYPSVVNIDAENATTQAERNKGGLLGTLSVTIQNGSGAVYGAPTGANITTGSLTLNITDKDPEHFNFNYGKVQLPYYNDVGSGNYTGNRVVTGWKIVGITGGTEGTYSTGEDVTYTDGVLTKTPYNFADRNCTNKDLYGTNGSYRVFNQGAYWDVPEGVTAITIEPYWAKCTYLADPNADKVYNTAMNAGYDVPNVGGGQIYTNKSSYSIAGESQVVFTTMGDAIASSNNGLFAGVTGTPKNQTVYDYAVVLVGNYHNYNVIEASMDKPYTVTSIDLDGDNEPDYSYILRFDSRKKLHPVRVDFINIPGLGMAQKSTGGTGTFNFGILQPKGWFESTNTSLFRVTQFEYDNNERVAAPYILQGGVMEQWVNGQSQGHANKTTYFHVGGNVWFKEFHRGTHQDQTYDANHSPVSVTGGDFDQFHLTGLYRADVTIRDDNAECYITGGRFGVVAGTGMDGIGHPTKHTNGNITWIIDNADIKEFYAGSFNADKPAQGNLHTIVNGGHIDLFCGGPKFGDMNTGKTVTTTATNCTFGTFFGAGYGGNSYSRQAPFNHNIIVNFPHSTSEAGNHESWNDWLDDYYKQEYNATFGGVSTQFNYQFLPMSGNADNVARIFVEYVKFSLATTRNVTSTLTGCTITGNFYGGGSLGKVDGNVTSTLTGCTVNGDAFGAGFSGSLPTVEVDSIGFRTEPYYYEKFGSYRTGVKGSTTTYNWKQGNAISIDKDKKILYTNEDLTALGTVTGKAILNIESSTTVRGNVYGGGESSDVAEKTKTGVDVAAVQVNIKGGTVIHDVFGGGKGKTTVVNGNVEVNIGTKTGEAPSITYTGEGKVNGNVYGGSALGAVNAKKGDGYDAETNPTDIAATPGDKTTKVNIYKGTVDGSVFGGGLGQTSPSSIAAQNYGNTFVTVENSNNAEALVNTAVYGGANVNGVMKADATVTILGGTVGTDPGVGGSIKNVVFGGGFGQPTLVNGNVKVNVGTKSGEPAVYAGNAIIWGNVYGGGAFGNVNTSKPASVLVFDATKKTEVYLYAGTINGNVYGGGLGKKEVVAKDAVGSPGDPGYEPAVEHEDGIEAFVGGDVFVLLDGAKLKYDGSETPLTGQIFGCNNLNGTPKGHVKVHVKRTIDSTKDTEVARDSRTTYDVTAVYGGGNQADYIPTDALLDPAVEGNPAKIEKATAEVIIDGCDDTSIEYVYGGGNAAAVPASEVTILGSYIIHYVFGGGNGKSTSTFTNPGANIGLYNNGTSYGSGKAVTKLVGCHAHYVFGGSNTKGNVREGTSILMPDKSLYPAPEYDCCGVRDIGEIYGAGNEAEQDGSVTLILGCVHNMKNVYGGARMANVKGGIDLVVTSGTFEGVFGGNDMSGTIQGPITVTIEETGCDPLEIDNLYLGGNLAAYSVYGYKDNGTARTKAEYDALVSQIDGKTEEEIAASDELKAIAEQLSGLPYSHPVLNVVSCTRIGKTSGEDLGGAFGGGFGNGAIMYGNPTVNINMIPGLYAERIDRDSTPGADNNADALGTITNVYGGGKLANVEGNTAVNIGTEEKIAHRTSMGVEIPVGDRVEKDVQSAIITENVFGAGKGRATLATDVDSAYVSGNTTIVIEKATIAKSVYGGGELSQVGGDTHVNVSGGIIGTAGQGEATYGNVYGGGLGNSSDTKFGLVQGNTNIAVTGGEVLHNIYGGGAYGSVGTYSYDEGTGATICADNTGDATITIAGGTIGTDGKENGMVFGSSRGDVAKPTGEPARDPNDYLAWVNNTHVTIGLSAAEFETQKANEPYKSYGTYESYKTTGAPHVKGSVYGSGENGHTYKNTEVIIHSGTIGINDPGDPDGGASYALRGNVYGGGCGTDQYDSNNDGTRDTYNPWSGIVQRNATVLIDGGQVVHNVYGAGAMGSVEGGTSVTIAGGTVGVDGTDNGFVYAAAKGDEALAESSQAHVGTTELNISGGTVWGSAFGGGQAGIVKKAVTVSLTGGEVKHDVYGGGALARTNTQYDGTDETYKTYVTNVTLAGATIAGDLYGGGLGSNTVAADVKGPVTVAVSSGSADRVFGCNNVNGAPQSTVTVNVSGGTIGNAYGGGNQATYSYTDAVNPQNLQVNISGGTIGNVFGGGLSAQVAGGIDVNITGGTVTDDVYGGGALANTNTANWDSGTGTWAAGMNAEGSTTYKTNITLTSGTVGNVYGGALGQHEVGTVGNPGYTPAIEPKVYGDIAVTVNKEDGTGTARFLRAYESHEYQGSYKDAEDNIHYTTTTGNVYTKGCVFGANNKEGTPKGNINVTVWSTTPEEGKSHEYGIYEIQNVYGGGNLSDYEPADGKTSQVDIHGCDRTSIQFVFGGGNAARVPETHVNVYGSFEIETAFGGGNGSEPFWSRAEEKWVESPGAAVGDSYVNLYGGYLHSAFGGSYERGTVEGTTHLNKSGEGGDDDCVLRVTDVFGGGKAADVKGDIEITISDCSEFEGLPDDDVNKEHIKNVYAGSYNARIFGNITMTVTSGIFTNVFGGNHTSGFINGSITINIEETEECKPVIIDNLYGGGNYAPYPGLGAANDNPNITVNVKAATRIGNIYGGCNHADVTGDTEVNINMIKGWWAGRTYVGEDISLEIPLAIGTIGNVYGGGNEGKVIGNTTVNIGTEEEIELVHEPVVDKLTGRIPVHMKYKSTRTETKTIKDKEGHDVEKTYTYYKYDVLGANIKGDVFGGCNLDDVTGNTTVNICTADYSADDPETDGYERVSIGGSVYGGGNRGDVLGNTKVTMSGGNRPEVDGAYVFDGIYGGGLRGSVGTVTSRVLPTGHPTHAGCLGGKPDAYADGTGTCTVVVSGGQVGPVEVALDGGGMKNTKRYFKATGERNGPVDYGFVFGAGRGEVEDPYSDPDVDFHTYVKETEVTISGTALVMASVYGGGENGRVRGDTWVKIQGGQIGCGEGQKETVNGVLKPKRYEESQFIDPLGTTVTDGDTLAECPHWDYGKVKNGVLEYLPYDPLYFEPLLDEDDGDDENNEADEEGADGHTYYGNVFGGGSGYYPYEKANKGEKKHDWLRSAGWVEGNTTVDITGGHILTNVYGGNETTDVGGKCTINMSGGTIGVPRTLAKIAEHPVTCYLFGAGKGDQRTHFNTWTNVNEVVVNVTGGIIYGSVFGGGEDGHVLGDAAVNISKGGSYSVGGNTFTNGPIIGTWGTSYVDGNVFGGGRGFSGEALTAGSIGGNVTVNITGGKMLGSVYGGGRLASVGIGFTEPEDPAYGQLISDGKRQVFNQEAFTLEDAPGAKHGYITINISGDAKIGTTTESGSAHPVGGNVFGGSMGRIDLLDDTRRNPLWPKLAVVKESKVTINGGEIMNSVYGGSEYGIVRDLATVDIKDGIVHGNVFGGGYGHDDETPQTISVGQYTSPSGETTDLHVTFTPMQWTGCVSGDTEVNIKGGTVEKNVYGGGDLASVGLIDHYSDAEGNYNNIIEHKSQTPGVPYDGFDLSWPYKFTYIAGNPDSDYIGGKATVSITGGRIGKAGDENSGYVFGGSKGRPMERYHEAHIANVRETKVTIDYDNTPEITNAASAATHFGTASNPGIQGAVYGGGEDGHVYENASVEIKGGIIGYSVYAGGKGINKYSATLKNRADNGVTTYETEIYSITAGKVYGNTSLTMTGGHVVRNVYGGGYMASVGKGNYAGGADDYTSVDNFNYNGVDMGPMCGYGEYITGNLWDKSNANSIAFLESGKATIKITGGIIGTPDGTYDELPTGNVVGGSRGEAAPNVFNMPVHDYNPTFHVGNINEAEIIIGTEGGDNSALHIYGSVYGGGQDGHMRRDAKVTVYSGEIGKAYTSGDQNNLQWKHRGNVYGSGSGIGQFEFDYDGNGSIDPNDPNETGLSFLAGCVARFSEVDIRGGIIHRNVYGGGSVAGTGMPKFYGQDYEPYKKGDTADGHGAGKQSQNTVSISGGTIGQEGYGGNVFGASRGEAELVAGENPMFATSIWTDVDITGGTIYNNVYGGGELGTVKQSTHVNLLGGEIKHEAYGGGRGIKTADGTGEVEANIGGDATVILNNNNNGADADGSKKGCIVEKIYGCNDQNGSPKGHVLVHVFATQHKDKANISQKIAPPAYSTVKGKSEAYAVYLKRVIDVAKSGEGGTLLDGITESVITAAESVWTKYKDKDDAALNADEKAEITNAAKSVVNEIESLHDYDVKAVYGGGDLAAYEPYGPAADGTDADYKATTEKTEVIIEGCDVTSIEQVYGGGNAASVPATDVKVNSVFIIDQLYGGGNGLDTYQIGSTYYENPGANVGYKDFTTVYKSTDTGYTNVATNGSGEVGDPYKAITNADATDKTGRETNYAYGDGQATTTVTGGHIHKVYGGSNHKGNIRYEVLSQYQHSGTCELVTDETYGGSKDAETDGEIHVVLDCVEYGGTYFGGSQNANINNNVTIDITNGTFDRIFGGNNTAGTINGAITINIEEKGCTPIIIGELYGGGYMAPYSIYGYNESDTYDAKDESGNDLWVDDSDHSKGKVQQRKPYYPGDDHALDTPHRDPYINIISATSIGSIYGGGYKAKVIGSPHINVNMTKGMILYSYAKDMTGYSSLTVDNGGIDASGNMLLPIGTIGNIFGGGNQADVIGNTYVDIGTGKWRKKETGEEENLTRNAAFITGNVYGGGKMGHVGYFSVADAAYNTAHPTATLPIGKPYACADGTGTCYVTISNGDIGPNDMSMWHLDGTGNVPANDKPDDSGHVFGAGQGTQDYATVASSALKPSDWDTMSAAQKLEFVNTLAFVDKTFVTINGAAWVKGSVFGGGENGHVLNDTDVKIEGNCQIGNGHILVTDKEDGTILVNRGVNRRYTTAEWTAGHLIVGESEFSDLSSANKNKVIKQFEASLPECDSWLYGKKIEYNRVVDYEHHAPYDKFAGTDGYSSEGGARVASSGRAFNGNVFGGGSGYFPYEAGKWNPKAGQVEGNATVTVTGGHIMTSLFGGCEMSSLLGNAHVTMSGGTVGVPRTLDEIAAHPVTCYVFGGGKGEARAFLDGDTNVQNATVDVTGGWVYGSVFGGAEDGHVLGNTTVNISGTTPTSSTTYAQLMAGDATKIGTWGTSYVDGNIFGGGRGFDGHNNKAGRVAGNANINITGGVMLGSIYGGGRLGSVGMGTDGSLSTDVYYTQEECNTYNATLIGHVTTSDTNPATETNYTEEDANAFNAGLAGARKTTDIKTIAPYGHINISITGGTIGNDYEFIMPNATNITALNTELSTSLDADFKKWSAGDWTTWKNYYHVPETDYDTGNARLLHTKGGNVFAGCMGRRLTLSGNVISDWTQLAKSNSTKLTIGGTAWIMSNVYGGGEFGAVQGCHSTDGKLYGTEISIADATIGTEVTGTTPVKTTVTTPSTVKYTFGSVYGGGYGTEDDLERTPPGPVSEHTQVDRLGAFVSGNTSVSMSSGHVRASVYGGGEVAAVGGDTYVTISGGEIGRNEVYSTTEPYYEDDSPNPGYVKFGGATMGNVYGGGKGTKTHPLIGVVKGNTNVTINAGSDGEPKIYHNVYGGGALGSVGTFIFSDGVTGDVMSNIPKGIPYHWTTDKTGIATVNILGGTIGISGRDNGMVNGSSRGDVAKPVGTVMGKDGEGNYKYIPKDPYDKMAWVQQSIVNIGSTGTAGPHIKGSVYGGGENGHVFTHATVNVKSGTIGIVNEADPWFDFGDEAINEKAWVTRGNVYGAGCGTDTYWDDKNGNSKVDVGEEFHNPWAGCVIGNTDVNISGGWVAQSVYGGGSLGSVGRILEGPTNIIKHEDKKKEFALSWPVGFTYLPLSVTDPVDNTTETGKATVKITGGRIGTTGSDNGDVFGGSRGEAGDRYDFAQLANVRTTEVTVDYTTPPTGDDILAFVENYDREDDANKYSLRVKDGVNAICGSVYGGSENGHVNADTKVTLTKGLIGHAIYGGGKGKGMYKKLKAGAVPYSDDPDDYDELNDISAGKVYGNTQVIMEGGHVLRNIYGGGNLGSVGKGNYAGGADDYYPSGYGETLTGNLWDNVSDNSKAFMNSGKTSVNIKAGVVGFMAKSNTPVKPMVGDATTFGAAVSDATLKKKLVKVMSKDGLPTGNIFGGCRGQAAAEPAQMDPDLYPEILPVFLGYVNETAVTIGDATHSPRIYGSVYGGSQDGHVRRSTNVTINKGEIGIKYDTDNVTTFGDLQDSEGKDNLHWLHRGNVYGSGSGIGTYEDSTGEHPSSSAGSVTHCTTVTVGSGMSGVAGTEAAPGNVIYRNVYGGGSLASVIPPSYAMGGDAPNPDDTGGIGRKSVNTVTISGAVGVKEGYNEMYGGEVYGAGRGEKGLDPTYFALSVWTKVRIMNGATIMNNVFGGGDAGKVKKDTDVIVGYTE